MARRGCCRIGLLWIWFVSHSNGSMEWSEWRERENGPRWEREECVGEWGEERGRGGERRGREEGRERERDATRLGEPPPVQVSPLSQERGGREREEEGEGRSSECPRWDEWVVSRGDWREEEEEERNGREIQYNYYARWAQRNSTSLDLILNLINFIEEPSGSARFSISVKNIK